MQHDNDPLPKDACHKEQRETPNEPQKQSNMQWDDQCKNYIETCRTYITEEIHKICANDVRHTTDAGGLEWYSVIDFITKVCSTKTKKQAYNTWDFFRSKSKFKAEIASFVRHIDFRYESAYSPSEGVGKRQNETPAVTLWGLQRMLTILTKKHVGIKFHRLVDVAFKGLIPIDASSSISKK